MWTRRRHHISECRPEGWEALYKAQVAPSHPVDGVEGGVGCRVEITSGGDANDRKKKTMTWGDDDEATDKNNNKSNWWSLALLNQLILEKKSLFARWHYKKNQTELFFYCTNEHSNLEKYDKITTWVSRRRRWWWWLITNIVWKEKKKQCIRKKGKNK